MPPRKVNTTRRATKKVAVLKNLMTLVDLFNKCVDEGIGSHGGSSSMAINVEHNDINIEIYDDDYESESFYSIEEACDHLNNLTKAQVIENVGSYEAKVFPTYIEVGCERITLEKFDELAKAVAKVRA